MRFSFLCLLACAEPFALDRHNLNSFRIIEAEVVDGRANAVVWSGTGVYHQQQPYLQWFVDNEVVAEGYDAEVPVAESYELKVESPAGDILWADVQPGIALVLPTLARYQWKEEEGQSYDMEAREGVILDDGPLQTDSVARIQLEASIDAQLRWSADAGTILELSQTSTDVFPNRIYFEDDEVIQREEDYAEEIHVFVLALDGQGGIGYSWLDLDFRDQIDLVYTDNMILPLEDSLDSGLYRVDFEQQNAAFVLSNPETVSEIPIEIPHPCMDSALLNIAWLRQGRCGLTDLDGLSVVVRIP